MCQMFMKIELCQAVPFRMLFPGGCSWAGQTLSWVTLGTHMDRACTAKSSAGQAAGKALAAAVISH